MWSMVSSTDSTRQGSNQKVQSSTPLPQLLFCVLHPAQPAPAPAWLCEPSLYRCGTQPPASQTLNLMCCNTSPVYKAHLPEHVSTQGIQQYMCHASGHHISHY